MRLLAAVLLLATGTYLALHPLWAHGRTYTPSRWLDALIALALLLRGWQQLRPRRILERPRQEE